MAKQNDGPEKVSQSVDIVAILAYIFKTLLDEINNIRRLVKNSMADIQVQLDNIEKRLDEASAELLAEIAQLKGEQLTDAGKAALDRIETKVNALADVVPGPDAVPSA